MSLANPASSPKAPTSLLRSISHVIKKLTDGDKAAPLFVALRPEDGDFEEIVELACGHIVCKTNENKASGASFKISLHANLSIFEATRCPMCEYYLAERMAEGNGNQRCIL